MASPGAAGFVRCWGSPQRPPIDGAVRVVRPLQETAQYDGPVDGAAKLSGRAGHRGRLGVEAPLPVGRHLKEAEGDQRAQQAAQTRNSARFAHRVKPLAALFGVLRWGEGHRLFHDGRAVPPAVAGDESRDGLIVAAAHSRIAPHTPPLQVGHRAH
jgi:hypothetical protein